MHINHLKRILALTCAIFTGLNLSAEPGDGLELDMDLGPLHIEPYIQFIVGYDSNIFYDESDEQDDIFFATRLGVDHQKPIGIFDFDFGLYYYLERFADTGDADDEDFGITFDLDVADGMEFGGGKYALDFDAGVSETDRVAHETGSLEQSRSINFGAQLDRYWGSKAITELYYRLTDTGFDGGSLLRFDQSEHLLGLSLVPRLTDKTAGVLSLEYGTQDSDNRKGNENWLAARVGARTVLTDKTSVNLTVGVLDHSFGITAFNYDADIRYQATDKIAVTLEGGNKVLPSISVINNFALENQLGLAVDYAMREDLMVRGALSWVNNELDKEVPLINPDNGGQEGVGKADSDTVRGTVKVVYAPEGSHYNLFLENVLEQRDSSLIKNDYTQYLLTGGLVLLY